MGGYCSKCSSSIQTNDTPNVTKTVYHWRIVDRAVPYDIFVGEKWSELQMETLCDGHAYRLYRANFSDEQKAELKVVLDKRTVEMPLDVRNKQFEISALSQTYTSPSQQSARVGRGAGVRSATTHGEGY